MSASVISAPTAGIGGTIAEYHWIWEEQKLKIVYETLGAGAPVLLLPAFSTVSTRAEMRGLAVLLAQKFQVVAVDWPGFGQSSRPKLDYKPALYQQFLQDFVKTVFNAPVSAIAAGHAAGYVMQLAGRQPPYLVAGSFAAPTWCGPLVAAMGEHRGWYGVLKQVVRSPIFGQSLYKLNTTPSFLGLMYRRHVYGNRDKVMPEFVDSKWQTTQQPGARFAPAAFVTGSLDPVQNRDDFLTLFQPLSVPVLVVIGEQTPPKSRAEMDALTTLPGVQTQILPGSLGLHEEYAAALAETILPFLQP
jgi:pimeloyl-ACP methyl ester carboxylesterase